jgi:hypothetical protein
MTVLRTRDRYHIGGSAPHVSRGGKRLRGRRHQIHSRSDPACYNRAIAQTKGIAMLGRSGGTRRPDPAARGWLPRLALALLAAGSLVSGAAAQTVPTYHGAADRGGLYVTPALTWAAAANVQPDTAFDGTVTGAIYAQPLYWTKPGLTNGWVIVATEENIVYALQANTGKVVWQRALGTPVTGGLPCGNILPLGVTGTPVIDPATGTLYLNAVIQGTEAQGPIHKIFAIDLATGQVLPGWPINVQAGVNALDRTLNVIVQGQRSALTFIDGSLFVTYGGLSGDCVLNTGNGVKSYHGVVVQVSPTTRQVTAFWRTRASKGGIWSQSGIAYDGQSMFVTTGNTTGTQSWGDGEAVIRLRPGLPHYFGAINYFTPSNWLSLDGSDTDLGGTGAIPIDVPTTGGATLARMLALGKDGNAYLLDRNNLGGIGGQLAVTNVSNNEIISAAARFPTADAVMVAFVSSGQGVGCPRAQSGNLVALAIGPSTSAPISTAWCTSVNGNGAPVVTTTDGAANPIVWVAGAQGDNQLHAFRGTDGAPLYSGGNMSGMQRNTTILVANGRFYIGGGGKVFAFTQ